MWIRELTTKITAIENANNQLLSELYDHKDELSLVQTTVLGKLVQIAELIKETIKQIAE